MLGLSQVFTIGCVLYSRGFHAALLIVNEHCFLLLLLLISKPLVGDESWKLDAGNSIAIQGVFLTGTPLKVLSTKS